MSLAITKTKRSFAYGWSMVLYSGLMYFFYAGLTTDGLNIFVQSFAEMHGWDSTVLLSLSSLGGWIGIIGSIFFAQVVVKKGSRYVSVLSLLCTGIVTIAYGRVNTMFGYAVCVMLIYFFANGFANVAANTLITSWFPKKKGIAFGWATMGMPLATALFVPIVAILFSTVGIPNAFLTLGIAIIVIAIISIYWVKDNPEMIGLAPDGDDESMEEIETSREEILSYDSEWTYGRLIRDKTVWLISISYGLLFLVTVGIVSQLVPRLMSMDYTLNDAIKMLSLAAVVGIFGSYMWGLLDQKLGTKKASMVYAVWYISALVLLIVSTKSFAFTLISIVMVGIGIGGIGNLQPSMVTQVFGRLDYAAASRVIIPIVGAIRVGAFAVIGIALKLTGSFEGGYVVLIVFDIIALLLIFFIDDRCVGNN